MSTKKKKSDAIKFLEGLSGGPLTIGELIEAIRLADEQTQPEFAKRLGISKSHLNDIEKGRKSVSLERAARFARYLRLSEAQFVTLALQSQLDEARLNYKVDLKKSAA